MIIQKTVIVSLSPANIKYYELLGYDIPKHRKAHHNILQIKRGTKIEVNVDDLPKSSTVKILCKCDCCGKERKVSYGNYRDLCLPCKFNTEEYKLLQRKINTGTNNPNYDFELSEKERVIQHRISGIQRWKQEVKERDNFTCQKCGSKNHLQVHHINNYRNFKEQRTYNNNGITLCKECHISANGKSIHNIYGKYVTEEELHKFMNSDF